MPDELTMFLTQSFHIEQLDSHLFKSCIDWAPRARRARGVFGGILMGQAMLAASKCVQEQFLLHSLHCCFTRPGAPHEPIIYSVEHLRRGKTYHTCSVKATQKDHIILIMLCSFQVPELRQLSYHMPMPSDVAPPEECLTDLDRTRKALELSTNREQSDHWRQRISDLQIAPFEIRRAPTRLLGNGQQIHFFWMKITEDRKPTTTEQLCILAALSDMWILSSAPRQLDLRLNTEGPKELTMQSSLDHSLYVYTHEFDTRSWMLHVTFCPAAALGRGFTHGYIYDRAGTLCAVMSQEGVIRTPPTDSIERASKL